MRYIDAFNHFYPEKFFTKLQTSSGAKDVVKITAEIAIIHELQASWRASAMMEWLNWSRNIPIISRGM